MPIHGKSIRLFVSSTFSDFEEERDILHQEVFPHLARLCSAYGHTFQPVDLRWGISQETAEQQRTLQICLREVQRSIEVSPRPNFLILLGDRYGWQPLPDQIPKDEFDAITKWLRGVGKNDKRDGQSALLSRWYKLDKNAIFPAYFLQPRPGLSDKGWHHREDAMRRALRDAANALDFSPQQKRRYFLSATAFEIDEAVFGGTVKQQYDVREHVLCFHRLRLGSPPSKELKLHEQYDDLQGDVLDDEARNLRLSFQQRLKAALGPNYLSYPAFMAGDSIENNHLKAFAADARLLLETVIRQQLDERVSVSPLEQELALHENFAAERAHQFVGREEQLREIIASSTMDSAACRVLLGRGGSGKTSLMAKLCHSLEASGYRTCVRFLGITVASSNGLALLESLCMQLAHMAGTSLGAKVRGFGGWRDEFKRLLYATGSTSSKPLFVIIDALDQLSATDPASALEWIPDVIPNNVHFVISTTPGEIVKKLKQRFSTDSLLQAGDIDQSDGEALLRYLLRTHGRTLQEEQIRLVLAGFRCDPSPLYLRLASEIVCYWRALDGMHLELEKLPETTSGLIVRVLNRLSALGNHGASFVATAMALLAAARQGLTEAELVDLLSMDAGVMAIARQATPKGRDITRLPFIYWSRLRDELSPYLAERDADGLAAIGFFHRLFAEAVQEKCLRTSRQKIATHSAIAAYFGGQSDYLDNGHQRPNRRRLSELPYQLIQSKQIETLLELLSQQSYFNAKVHASLLYDLLAEYRECYEQLLAVDQARQAKVCARTLACHLVQSASTSPKRLDIEDVHAVLGFHRDNRFYVAVLGEGGRFGDQILSSSNRGARAMVLGMQARQANIWRRNGELDRAKGRLLAILPQIKRWSSPSELARVQYDLGYIAYLEGNFATSIPLIDESAQSSMRDGNQVGAWISRCVAEHQRWLLEIGSGKGARANQRFALCLARALPIFEKGKHIDSTSSRWVMNVYAHRLSIAYRAGDAREVHILVQQLKQDPWLAAHPDDAELTFVRLDARIALLERRNYEAAKLFQRYVDRRLKMSEHEESLAEDYLDLALAYWYAGKRSDAKGMWRKGLSLPANAGNCYWQAIIRHTSLRLMHSTNH